MGNYTKQDIIQLVEEKDVQFIRLQFTDVSGTLKNVAITASQLEKALDNSLTRANDSKQATSFSASTVNNIVLAKQKIEEIKSVYNKYKDRSNIGQIVELARFIINSKDRRGRV